ncbi:hypothetical protein MesoLjLa_07090 [Mesorhizobium sp. L-2-11]|nr:hypothetical protein MesoLjLa_07090 [Mesorhizobium sp. L-2-11]
MDMELGNILAGKAVWAGKENDQPAVEHRSVRRSELPIGGNTVLNHGTGNRFNDESALRAGNADHGNPCRQPAARQGDNGIT